MTAFPPSQDLYARAKVRSQSGTGDRAPDQWIARKAVCFNFLPSRYAHPSHWEPLLPPPLRNRLLASARREASLSRLLLSAQDLLGKWQTDFSQRNQRLALAYPHLSRLALYAGAFFHADALAHLIEKRSIAEIQARIGRDAYEFALRRATLFQKWRPFDPPTPSSGLAEEVERAGQHALATCFAGTGPAIERRLDLIRPAGKTLPALKAEQKQSEAAGLLLAHLLCKEIAPEWTPHLL